MKHNSGRGNRLTIPLLSTLGLYMWGTPVYEP